MGARRLAAPARAGGGHPGAGGTRSQERVAMIAHEVGHDRNGDVSRGVFIGSAVNGLDTLSDVLRPPPPGRHQPRAVRVDHRRADVAHAPDRRRALAGGAPAAARHAARRVPRGRRVGARRRDRRGDRAPRAAAAHSTFQGAIQQAALADDASGALDRVRAALRSVPERERERRRRVARLEQTRLEDTHPPTGMRIALLEERARGRPPSRWSRAPRPGSTPSSSRS